MPYSLSTLYNKNVTTILLLWTINLSYAEAEYFGVIDAFIGDKEKPTYFGYYIFVLVDKEKVKSKKLYEHFFCNNDRLVESYCYDEKFTVFKYRVPREYENDYDIICSGKYSSVSEKFKNEFPSQQSAIDLNTDRKFVQNNRAKKLITRQWYFKDDYGAMLGLEVSYSDEWWKSFNLDREVLDIEIIETKLLN